jgi:Radical SAM superfamily
MGTLRAEEELKLRLLAEGVKIHQRAHEAWIERYGGPLTLAEYATTSGVALVLPGELYVNAPLVDGDDVAELRCDDQFYVAFAGAETPVRVIPVPAYHEETQLDLLDGSEQRHTNYGVTHTDRCRVSPIAGCAWKCRFCDLPYEFAYRRRHVENLLNVVRVAERDPLVPARHVLVSGGTPRRGRPGASDEEWIDEVYATLVRESSLPVDVMMPPRRDLRHPEWLASVGVNMVSVNMEVSDPERARELTPAKARLGRDHYLRYIEHAVESFGVGHVQSLIVFGEAIEPLESTLRGVRDLVERGCIPVLSPFRPDPVTPMGDLPGATLAQMIEVYLRTLELCERAGTGVRPGPRCVPCHHNTVTLPDDSGFYLGLDANVADRCVVS